MRVVPITKGAPRVPKASGRDSCPIKLQAEYMAARLKATGQKTLTLYDYGRDSDAFELELCYALGIGKPAERNRLGYMPRPPDRDAVRTALRDAGFILVFVDRAEYSPAYYKAQLAEEIVKC